MEAFAVLEEKINKLVFLVKSLKSDNGILQEDLVTAKAENEELKTENAKLAEDNAQLITQMKGIEGSVLQGNKQLKEFDKERSSTKAVVDDLIKSIDSLVEFENQQ